MFGSTRRLQKRHKALLAARWLQMLAQLGLGRDSVCPESMSSKNEGRVCTPIWRKLFNLKYIQVKYFRIMSYGQPSAIAVCPSGKGLRVNNWPPSLLARDRAV
jgi:hypothetical protein